MRLKTRVRTVLPAAAAPEVNIKDCTVHVQKEKKIHVTT